MGHRWGGFGFGPARCGFRSGLRGHQAVRVQRPAQRVPGVEPVRRLDPDLWSQSAVSDFVLLVGKMDFIAWDRSFSRAMIGLGGFWASGSGENEVPGLFLL